MPNVVLPSLKVTVPVAAEGVTEAVNVMELPYVDGFDEDETVTEEEDFANNIPVKARQPRTRIRIRTVARITIRSLGILKSVDNLGTDPPCDNSAIQPLLALVTHLSPQPRLYALS